MHIPIRIKAAFQPYRVGADVLSRILIIIAEPVIVQACFSIFILSREAEVAFGVIRVIGTGFQAPERHLSPRVRPCCPTDRPAFREDFTRCALMVGDEVMQFPFFIPCRRNQCARLIQPLNPGVIRHRAVRIDRRFLNHLIAGPQILPATGFRRQIQMPLVDLFLSINHLIFTQAAAEGIIRVTPAVALRGEAGCELI
ncbi:Uncharacterised protein [Morganella morganii]|nr:Uncharacterised protein [Morganella morganii]